MVNQRLGQRLAGRQRLALQGEEVEGFSGGHLRQRRRDAQRLAVQAEPRLLLDRGRLALLADVPPLPQTPGQRLDFGQQPAQGAATASLAEVGAQTGEPLARPGQVVGKGGVHTGQIADARRSSDPCAAPCPLPVEEAQLAGYIIDQNVFGVQVAVEKACLVQAGEHGPELDRQRASLARFGAGLQRRRQRGRGGDFFDQQEGASGPIFSRGQPARAGQIVAFQRLQHLRLAHRARHPAEARQEVQPSRSPANSLFAFQIECAPASLVAQHEPPHLPAGMAADDQRFAVEEVLRIGQAQASQPDAVCGVHGHEAAGKHTAMGEPRQHEEQATRRHQHQKRDADCHARTFSEPEDRNQGLPWSSPSAARNTSSGVRCFMQRWSSGQTRR